MKNSKSSFRFFSACAGLLVFLLQAHPATAAGDGEKREEKEWAFLTFLNGFNNLDSFGVKDLKEMEKVGSTDQMHVVVQWASLDNRDVRRLYIEKSKNPGRVTSPVVENIGIADMGDYRSVVEFVKWAAKKYPAKRYFLNIWNHGNGWHFAGVPTTRDISYDDLSGNRITTEQLGLAAKEISAELGRPIDIVGADACLMAMGEVMGQVKGNVGHFIASEEVEPADGWDYERLLTEWNAGGKKSAADVARLLTRTYLESYGENRKKITLSGMDLSQYEPLAAAVRGFGEAIASQPVAIRQKISALVRGAQSYTHSDYKDLGEIVDRISADPAVSLSPDVLIAVKTALKKFVVANVVSKDYANSHGVSIWYPETATQFQTYRNRYQNLTFNRDTAWIDAIQATLRADGKI